MGKCNWQDYEAKKKSGCQCLKWDPYNESSNIKVVGDLTADCYDKDCNITKLPSYYMAFRNEWPYRVQVAYRVRSADTACLVLQQTEMEQGCVDNTVNLPERISQTFLKGLAERIIGQPSAHGANDMIRKKIGMLIWKGDIAESTYLDISILRDENPIASKLSMPDWEQLRRMQPRGYSTFSHHVRGEQVRQS